MEYQKPRNAIEKALLILDILVDSQEPVRAVDLIQSTGFPSGTLHRLLNTLVETRYVQKTTSSDYVVGPKFLRAYQSLIRNPSLVVKSQAPLRKLSIKTGMTSNLGCLRLDEVLFLHSNPLNIEGPITYWPAGMRAPINSTSLGKALLAHLPESEQAELIRRLPLKARTPNTITTIRELKDCLALVRRNGYAVDDEEHDLGWRCIGAPVFDHRGQVVAAISISALTTMLPRHLVPSMAEHVKEHALAISTSLGHMDNQ